MKSTRSLLLISSLALCGLLLSARGICSVKADVSSTGGSVSAQQPASTATATPSTTVGASLQSLAEVALSLISQSDLSVFGRISSVPPQIPGPGFWTEGTPWLGLVPNYQVVLANAPFYITATARDAQGSPIAGIPVHISVISGPNTGQTFTGTTNENGTVAWLRTTAAQPGVDEFLLAYFIDPATGNVRFSAFSHLHTYSPNLTTTQTAFTPQATQTAVVPATATQSPTATPSAAPLVPSWRAESDGLNSHVWDSDHWRGDSWLVDHWSSDEWRDNAWHTRQWQGPIQHQSSVDHSGVESAVSAAVDVARVWVSDHWRGDQWLTDHWSSDEWRDNAWHTRQWQTPTQVDQHSADGSNGQSIRVWEGDHWRGDRWESQPTTTTATTDTAAAPASTSSAPASTRADPSSRVWSVDHWSNDEWRQDHWSSDVWMGDHWQTWTSSSSSVQPSTLVSASVVAQVEGSIQGEISALSGGH